MRVGGEQGHSCGTSQWVARKLSKVMSSSRTLSQRYDATNESLKMGRASRNSVRGYLLTFAAISRSSGSIFACAHASATECKNRRSYMA
eukprot:6178243-Pleurochrysis_carterae.AAC.1